MFIDTHAHLDSVRFDGDRKEIIKRAMDAGVGYIINPAITFGSNYDMQVKLNSFKNVFLSFGLHPNHIELDESLDKKLEHDLIDLMMFADRNRSRVVAIGETGLDYHRLLRNEKGELDEDSVIKIKQQEQYFRTHINLAICYEFPLIVHVREAHREAIDILRDYQDELPKTNVGVVHCFKGSFEDAMGYISMGYKLGIGGAVTCPENEELQNLIKEVSLENIVLETDSPYVLPSGIKAKRNTPCNIPYIAEKIAELKGIGIQEVERITTENAKRLFHI